MATPAWTPLVAEDFEQFVSLVKGLLPSVSDDERLFWFRGLSDATWHLETSLMRVLGKDELPLASAARLEDEALSAFCAKAHLFLSPAVLNKIHTKPCWWAVMQHYGAPTRLLDWTISPYVAAYFAVQENNTADAAVWAFCSQHLHASCEDELKSKLPDLDDPKAIAWYDTRIQKLRHRPIVIPLEFRYVTSERIAVQQGRFTMSFKAQQKHDCVIRQIGAQNVRKIVIPAKQKADFLLKLRDMNITGEALFPGIDGLGRTVREIVSVGAHGAAGPQCRAFRVGSR